MSGPDYGAPATKDQARALIEAGYRRPPVKMPPHIAEKYRKKTGRYQGKKLRRVSQRWIRENMTLGQAGYILRQIRGEKPKESWQAEVPARPALGITKENADDMIKRHAEDTAKRAAQAR